MAKRKKEKIVDLKPKQVTKEQLDRMQVELEKEYGTFDINITDGTINYPKEDVKTD